MWFTHPKKYVCKCKKGQKHFLYLKKSEKLFGKLILGNNEFAHCKIWHFHLSVKSADDITQNFLYISPTNDNFDRKV
jgi:hypothetical protein